MTTIQNSRCPQPVGDATVTYWINGFRLRIVADDAGMLASSESLLGRFRCASTDGSALRLRIIRSDWPPQQTQAAGLRQVWQGVVPPNSYGTNSVAPDRRRIELRDRGRLDVDLARHEACLRLAPHSAETTVGYFLLPLVCEGLTRTGHFPLHAACLAVRIGDAWQSVLIVAPSGTGKSTASLALVDSGWKLMSDDISLLCRQQGQANAWGLPRQCHVREGTRRLLPWLSDMKLRPTATAGTCDLPLESLGERAWSGPPIPLKCALVICLEQHNEQDHVLEPLDRATALMRVAEENVQPMEGVADRNAQQAFRTLAQLVRETPVCRLSAGPRLELLSDRILKHLASQSHV
jgi:hypothetical protein